MLGPRLAFYLHMVSSTFIGSELLRQYFIYRLGLRGRGPALLSCWYARLAFLLLTTLAASLVVWLLLGPIVTVFVALPASIAALLAWWWLLRNVAAERLLHISMYDCGSARQLAGECLVLEYYWGEGWTPGERHHAAASLRTACQWIEEKAEWRGVDTNFIYEELAKDDSAEEAPDVLETKEPGKGKLELLTKRAYERASLRMLRPDNFAIVVHVRQGGGGFALPSYNLLGCSRVTEVGFCNYLHPMIYAHEILHLFGAYDLYLDARSPITIGLPGASTQLQESDVRDISSKLLSPHHGRGCERRA